MHGYDRPRQEIPLGRHLRDGPAHPPVPRGGGHGDRRGRADGLSPLQAARTCDLDLIAAFTDTIDYNGGPLHCAV